MIIDPKGPVRLIMPNGTFDIRDVTRIVVGKILDPNKAFPKTYFREVRIECVEGAIQLLMESENPRSLEMEHERGSIFSGVKKQITG